jgi:mRNA-degrading endonuclease RelE of RelBE toxin-antitoxin system
MSRLARFQIRFAPEVVEHLDVIDRRYHHLIEKTLDERLLYAPDHETRNRKPVEQPAPFDATWELRFGPGNCFRVFYEIDDAARVVWILAIGIKERHRLLIGGEEFGP